MRILLCLLDCAYTIRKLAVRDRTITLQQTVLTEHGLDTCAGLPDAVGVDQVLVPAGDTGTAGHTMQSSLAHSENFWSSMSSHKWSILLPSSPTQASFRLQSLVNVTLSWNHISRPAHDPGVFSLYTCQHHKCSTLAFSAELTYW